MEEYNSNYEPANRGNVVLPHSRPEQPNQQYNRPQPNQPYGQPLHRPYVQPPNQPYGRSPYQQSYGTSKSPYKEAAIVSLITGISAIVFFWQVYFSCILALTGIITAAVYMSKRKDQRGLAIAGLITSIVGMVLSIIVCLFVFIFLTRLGSYTQQYYNDSYYGDDGYYYDDYNDYYDDTL